MDLRINPYAIRTLDLEKEWKQLGLGTERRHWRKRNGKLNLEFPLAAFLSTSVSNGREWGAQRRAVFLEKAGVCEAMTQGECWELQEPIRGLQPSIKLDFCRAKQLCKPSLRITSWSHGTKGNSKEHLVKRATGVPTIPSGKACCTPKIAGVRVARATQEEQSSSGPVS